MQKKYKIIFVVVIVAIGVGTFGFFAEKELSDITQRNEVKLAVTKTIESFNGNLDEVTLEYGNHYSFVLDEKLTKLVAHPREELINTLPDGLSNADISISEMIYRLDQYGSTWIHYDFLNPQTGNVDPKSSYLVKHGEYVFGAGYYSP